MFEGEMKAELGFSLEMALFSGVTEQINAMPSGDQPVFAHIIERWPKEDPTDTWCVSVKYIEKLFCDAFWESVRTFKGHDLKVRWTEGYRTWRDRDEVQGVRTRLSKNLLRLAHTVEVQQDVMQDWSSPLLGNIEYMSGRKLWDQ
jgi:hypothetical protein